VTVWGQGKVNVNTANPQTILALIGAYSTPDSPLVMDQEVQMKVLMVLSLLQSVTRGIPLMGSPKAFINTLKGQGLLGPMLQALELPPLKLVSESQLEQAISTESKVFSIYATGVVRSGKLETKSNIHAVVDMRGAPPPGTAEMLTKLEQLRNQEVDVTEMKGMDIPAEMQEGGLASVLLPKPGGAILYYRVD
jgi:general secretion pathway protein K